MDTRQSRNTCRGCIFSHSHTLKICSCLHTALLFHNYSLTWLIIGERTLSSLRDDNGDGLRCRADGDGRDAMRLLSATTMSLKISERTKGRLGLGRLCVVPTHFPYNIGTLYAISLESLYHSKPHSFSLPPRVKEVIIRHEWIIRSLFFVLYNWLKLNKLQSNIHWQSKCYKAQ